MCGVLGRGIEWRGPLRTGVGGEWGSTRTEVEVVPGFEEREVPGGGAAGIDGNGKLSHGDVVAHRHRGDRHGWERFDTWSEHLVQQFQGCAEPFVLSGPVG